MPPRIPHRTRPDLLARVARPARRVRRSSRLLALPVAALLGAAALGGCGIADPPLAPVTVTVTPTDDSTPTTSGPATPSQVPTVSAPGPVPVTLAAGHLRGARRSYAQAKAALDAAPAAPGIAAAFTSPTGNIFCDVTPSAPVKGCEVTTGRVVPPPETCADGGAPDVGRLELADGRAYPRCNSDTIRRQGVPALPYGTRTSVPGSPFACLSETMGVTCVDAAHGHGFFVARGTFATF